MVIRNHRFPPSPCRKAARRQKGGALLIFLAVIGIAVILLVGFLTRKTQQLAHDEQTTHALSQAKDALIGYAVTYRDDGHPDQVFGYLPLPDLGSSRNGTTGPEEGDAAGNFSGNFKNLTVIGRLPWRALGLEALRDGQAECLWYAVSGSFQNSQKANVLNWDSLGHLDIHTSRGTSASTVSTSGSNYAQRPVAIIFSAGAPLPGQNRQTSTVDTVDACGGNYDVRNYLDTYSADVNINSIVNYFAGSTNNATGFAYNLTNTSNASLLDAAALAAPKNMIFGDIQVGSTHVANDRMLIITADDIFRRIMKRSDFKTDIDTMMNNLAACLNGKPLQAASAGNKGMDNVTTQCTPTVGPQIKVFQNWKENLLYATLATPAQITIDGSPSTETCKAVLIFGGAKTGTQIRNTSTDKADPSNYLEGSNASAFPAGNAYSGAKLFNAANPSQDLVACITGTVAAPPITFTENIAEFVTGGSSGGSQVTINPDGSATLFITGASNKSGCFWYPNTMVLYDTGTSTGKTMRAYFKFRFEDVETNTTSSSYGDGFTFTIMRGTANTAYPNTMCGGSDRLGYEGSDGGGHPPLAVATPNIAMEFDTFYNSADSDPRPGGKNQNHIAFIADGDLSHGGVTFASPCAGTTQACYPASSPNWLEDNVTHQARMEISAGCNSTCSTCGGSGSYALVKGWVDCATCSDLGSNYGGTPHIKQCTALEDSLRSVKFGFTAGESAGVRQTIHLSDFAIVFN